MTELFALRIHEMFSGLLSGSVVAVRGGRARHGKVKDEGLEYSECEIRVK